MGSEGTYATCLHSQHTNYPPTEPPTTPRGPSPASNAGIVDMQGMWNGPLVLLGWAHSPGHDLIHGRGLVWWSARGTWAPPTELTLESYCFHQRHSSRERWVERARKACSQCCVSSFCTQFAISIMLLSFQETADHRDETHVGGRSSMLGSWPLNENCYRRTG